MPAMCLHEYTHAHPSLSHHGNVHTHTHTQLKRSLNSSHLVVLAVDVSEIVGFGGVAVESLECLGFLGFFASAAS